MANPEDTENTGIRSSEDIREDLQCPVCFKIPRTTPIFQCEEGHILCNTCHPRLHDCPVCRRPLRNTRCRAIEKIISKLPLRCINFNEGCDEPQALPDKIIEHEKECNYRSVKCVFKRCNDQVVVSKFLEHVTTGKHANTPVHGKDYKKYLVRLSNRCADKKESTYSPRFITCDGRLFAFMKSYDGNGSLKVSIIFIGSQKEADGFSCTIKVYGETSVSN